MQVAMLFLNSTLQNTVIIQQYIDACAHACMRACVRACVRAAAVCVGMHVRCVASIVCSGHVNV